MSDIPRFYLTVDGFLDEAKYPDKNDWVMGRDYESLKAKITKINMFINDWDGYANSASFEERNGDLINLIKAFKVEFNNHTGD